MNENVLQLMQRVRRIEIKTRALSNNIFAGEYHSAFKGRGMSFAEVREYQPGDDVRDIDWNVSARFDRTYVKVYEEERELTVMLLIDISASLEFGSSELSQREQLTEIAATLAFSAMRNNDKIGALFFSDNVELYIPPAKGKGHILRIIRELLTISPKGRGTNIGAGLEYLLRVMRKKSVAFLMSDFLDQEDYTTLLKRANQKHDLVAVQVYDERMTHLPNVGWMKLEDAETGHQQYVNTSSKHVRLSFQNWWGKYEEQLRSRFSQARVDYTSIATGTDFVKGLKQLFAKRQ
jgi:von willebrand factor, type A